MRRERPSPAKRREKRAIQHARLEARHPTPVPEALRERDPLIRPRAGRIVRTVRFVVVALAAVVAHVFILGAIFGASAVARAIKGEKVEQDAPIEVAIVETTPPPPEEVVQPEAPKPEEKAPEQPKPKEVVKDPPKEKVPPPPDPVNEKPKSEEPPKSDKPARRVVGLNLESTVEGGGGPSFGVGNTRMGETERKAERPTDVAPIEKTLGQPEGKAETGNKVATRIPTAGGKIVRPTRQEEVIPTYPAAYREQGIEADVVVRVSIDTTGKVTEVTIVAPSTYPEFNEAAKAAALKERWAPATRDGAPYASSATYTYRFRLNG